MTGQYWVRKAHRYLGLVVGLQILLWTASGLYFVFNDIDVVRGTHLSVSRQSDIAGQQGRLADINDVLETFREQSAGAGAIIGFELRLLLGKPVYEIQYANDAGGGYQLVDALSGALIPMLDAADAVAVAKADFSDAAGILSVELLDTADAHAEYRGRDLPVYRVSMDHDSGTNIYVSAQRGVVTARRNSTWRVFDFLWMIHTMDFETRDDFNNRLVQVFSVLALVTVLGGFLLWALSSRLFQKNTARRW